MSRFQPAVLGGLCIGVLSGLPVVGAVNFCCCLWVVGGGVLVVYLQQQNSPAPVETSEAVLGGLIAGAIGAVLMVLLNALMFTMTGPMAEQAIRSALDSNPELPPEIRARLLGLVSGSGLHLLMLAVTLPVYAVFSMLGALLGLTLFRRKPPAQPPAEQPPPPVPPATPPTVPGT